MQARRTEASASAPPTPRAAQPRKGKGGEDDGAGLVKGRGGTGESGSRGGTDGTEGQRRWKMPGSEALAARPEQGG